MVWRIKVKIGGRQRFIGVYMITMQSKRKVYGSPEAEMEAVLREAKERMREAVKT